MQHVFWTYFNHARIKQRTKGNKGKVSLVAVNWETLTLCVRVVFTRYYAITKLEGKGHHDLAGMIAIIRGS